MACMTNVGLFYSLEDSGIPRDIDKAIEYFEKAAERGSEKVYIIWEDLYKEKYPENYQEHYFTKLSIWARSNYLTIWTELPWLIVTGQVWHVIWKKGIEYLKKAADFRRSERIIHSQRALCKHREIQRQKSI